MPRHAVVDVFPRDPIPSVADPPFSDSFDGTSGEGIVVFETPAGLFAYDRNGLSFEPTEEADTFRADGTLWNGPTGRAEDGLSLPRLPGRRLFPCAWQNGHGLEAFYGD